MGVKEDLFEDSHDKEQNISIPDIDVGAMISKCLSEKRYSQADLAKRLGMPSSNVSRLLKRKSISTELLMEISMLLEFNFFSYFCNETDKYGEGKYEYVIGGLGDKISSRLKELKMTQTEFAAKLGVARTDVTRILNRSSFDTSKLVAISRVLNYNFFNDLYVHTSPSPITYEYIANTPDSGIRKVSIQLLAENEKIKETLQKQLELIKKLKLEIKEMGGEVIFSDDNADV